MGEIVKNWIDGGNLSVAFTGDGDGTAIFSSDAYEGIDREMPAYFKCGSITEERTVRQEGTRQQFVTADGKVFCVTNGGRFGTLKENGTTPEPPEPPIGIYTRLTYIESTGLQHIELDYNLKETDTIDALFEPTAVKSQDAFIFGSTNTWWSTYNNTGYARFGNSSSSTTVSNGTWRFRVQLSKGKVVLNEQTTTELTYENMAGGKIGVFSGMRADGSAYYRSSIRMMFFRITNSDGTNVIDLVPAKRENDGKIGMLDLISGAFYVNADEGEDFIAGNEVRISSEYELIDRVAFDNDKGFDTGLYGNEQTYIDVLFQRTDTTGADYLFGLSSGNRLTGYLTSSGYWRYGAAAPTFNTSNKNILRANVTPTKTTINETYKTFSTSAFTTGFTLPLGGHKGSTGALTKTYQGYVYYFRMKHGSNLLIDWYPCRRKSDGVEGFWDCITQNFVESI